MPPFWLTWWFKLVGGLIVVGVGPAFYFIRTRAIVKQKNKLELQVKERTKELTRAIELEKKSVLQAEEGNKAKSILLATMSHDIRTPMNGINGIVVVIRNPFG